MSIFRALTGPARLLLLVAAAWVVVWGSVWGYSAYRGSSMDRWISADIDAAQKLSDEGKEEQAIVASESIERDIARRDKVGVWADRAKWAGPIGLVAILFFGVGGWWVYQGFRKPVGSATH